MKRTSACGRAKIGATDFMVSSTSDLAVYKNIHEGGDTMTRIFIGFAATLVLLFVLEHI